MKNSGKQNTTDFSTTRVTGSGAEVCFGTGAICLLVHPAPAWLNPSLIFLGGLVTIMFPATKLQLCQSITLNFRALKTLETSRVGAGGCS